MTDEWKVKQTIRCARCGEEVEFKPFKVNDTPVPYLVQAVKGIKFGIFDTNGEERDGEERITNKEYESEPLCNDCIAALKQWLEYPKMPDCVKKEEQHEADLISQPDSLERIADELEDAEDWCDQNGEYGTGIVSIGAQTICEWSDRIRKLAEKEV